MTIEEAQFSKEYFAVEDNLDNLFVGASSQVSTYSRIIQQRVTMTLMPNIVVFRKQSERYGLVIRLGRSLQRLVTCLTERIKH